MANDWGNRTLQVEKMQDYPRPWRGVEQRSGITIKDAAGTTVMMIPFTGKASKDAKRRVANLVLLAVNSNQAGAPSDAAQISSGPISLEWCSIQRPR